MTAPATDVYCREVEAYLCRKNGGHLIRIVGPSFEHVLAWANQGIPLKVTEAGIDRYFARQQKKGPRRRPARIEFCEADVLDAFDDWRRAVGVLSVGRDAEGGPAVEEPLHERSPRRSLATHLEAVAARLTVLRGSDKLGPQLGAALDVAVRAVDGLIPEATRARGAARDAALARLMEIDRALLASALAALADDEREALAREARSELEPFRARMPDAAYAQAQHAASARLVRLHFDLPRLEI